MRKMLVLLLAALLILSTAACSAQSDNGKQDAEDTPIDGGWGEAQSIAVTDEVQAMFEKLNETMTGAYYIPIAYLSSQVVAGTNHMVLCKMVPSTANLDALAVYVIVTVYEDLESNADITRVLYSDVIAPQPNNPDQPVVGGWSEPDVYDVTDKAREAAEKANRTDDAYAYEPVALLGTQVVAGTNYLVLCKADPQVSGYSEYQILTIYADLQGNAEITDIADFSEDAGDVVTGSDADGASVTFQAE